jgi:hypothetical protein
MYIKSKSAFMSNDKETGNSLWIFISIIIALLIGQSIYIFMTDKK